MLACSYTTGRRTHRRVGKTERAVASGQESKTCMKDFLLLLERNARWAAAGTALVLVAVAFVLLPLAKRVGIYGEGPVELEDASWYLVVKPVDQADPMLGYFPFSNQHDCEQARRGASRNGEVYVSPCQTGASLKLVQQRATAVR